jgi:hypothetical protein
MQGGPKHEYGASVVSSRSNVNMEDVSFNGTGVGTGVASYGSPLEFNPPQRWGGSTIAGSSELEGTIVGEDEGDTRKRYPTRDSLN